MLKKIIALILILNCFFNPARAFAQRGDGGHDVRRDFHPREHVVHRLPPGYVSLTIGGLALLYSAGMFYRYTPAGYVVVTPPVGAVVPALPPGYTMVVENGVPYYYYGYTYYGAAPNGYAVISPPVAPAVPVAQAAPAQAVPAQTVAQAPISATAPSAVQAAAAKDDAGNRDVYDIYIPNGNGSYTSVTLRKTEKGFLGPQGEFYEDHPTIEQLRDRYAKK
jgi:hypothetical protein